MIKSIFLCSNCDAQSQKWAGRCNECGSWGTLSESIKDTDEKKAIAVPAGTAIPFSDIAGGAVSRIRTGIGEFDQVLGGGIVPGSLILLGGEPGIGKCVTGDTRLLDPTTGAYLPIASWKDGKNSILALDEKTHRFTVKRPSHFHDQGIKEIIEIRTRLGRSLKCTKNHPLLTEYGWKSVADLQLGDRIASPRALPYFGNDEKPEHHIKLIAYILSDGSFSSNSITVTAALPEIESDLRIVARSFNLTLKIYQKKNSRAKQFRFTQPYKNRKVARAHFASALRAVFARLDITWTEWARRAHVSPALLNCWRRGISVPNSDALTRLATAAHEPIDVFLPQERQNASQQTSAMNLLDSLELRGKKARTKSIPQCIFRLPRQQLSLFLKILFSCDGSVYFGKNKQCGISYSTISPTLASDVHHLLLRFGFVAKLRTKKTTLHGKEYIAYELQLLGTRDTQRFLKEINIFGREEAKKNISTLSEASVPSTHRDTIPTGTIFWKNLDSITGNISYKELSRQCGTTIHTGRTEGPLTRMTVISLAERYHAPYLEKLAYNDIYWDEIESITSLDAEPVYDITVPQYSNFVANDLIIHNSTIILQLCIELMKNQSSPILYSSGEESAEQVKLRFDRLYRDEKKPSSLLFLSETHCEKICATIVEKKPCLAIVDSIQTMYSMTVESEAGSISQVRACTVKLLEVAKQNGIAVMITGHVTKEGMVAGPKTLEHLVDTVLYLEGDGHHYFRLLKTAKNRFGSTNEIGVFEMTDEGLKEVTNPSIAFLSNSADAVGTATSVIMEGTRAFLVQIQSLISKTYFGTPARRAVGCDSGRVQLLIAVLSKRYGLNLGDQDVHVNVVGGIKISEPAADLAICASIISALKNKLLDGKCLFFGEVGLNGELRPVSMSEKRIKEAEKLGFTSCYLPPLGKKIPTKMKLYEIKNIRDLEI